MKSKLLTTPLLVLSLLIVSPDATPAQNGPLPSRGAMAPGRPVASPASPVPPAAPPPMSTVPAAGQIPVPNPAFQGVDPATGLPVFQSEWKDPNWEDPVKVVKEITYPSLPIKEVEESLKHLFDDAFDVLMPYDFGGRDRDNQSVDWLDTKVTLQLNNVKASEVFSAMNMLFENNRTPLRWELKMNGSRRTVLLRVLADPINGKPETTHVFFVGDLIGDPKAGGMSMSDVVNTVAQVSKMAYGRTGSIQFHEQAQLLIVKGSADQVSLIQQTIQALNMKASTERQRRLEASLRPKIEEPKPVNVGTPK